jgi:hypothetical protein
LLLCLIQLVVVFPALGFGDVDADAIVAFSSPTIITANAIITSSSSVTAAAAQHHHYLQQPPTAPPKMPPTPPPISQLTMPQLRCHI